MSDAPAVPVDHKARGWDLLRFRNGLAASPRFRSWAGKLPFLRRKVRAEGEAILDTMAGFVHSQTLAALVELDILPLLAERSRTLDDISRSAALPSDRAEVLLGAGIALGLLERRRNGLYALSLRGAALLGVPGLLDMVRHHTVLYRDLSDPAGFFRGETDPDLARFWPYVFGAGAAKDPAAARKYSRLMAQSQVLVAEETLRAVSFRDVTHLMDLGGGTGTFLRAVGEAWPHLQMTLVDLPAVVDAARSQMPPKVALHAASFVDDPLPRGADAISLVRVLYDHQDATVRCLLARVYEALPPGGRIIISEPMRGEPAPTRAADAYFAIYTLAMGTGKSRLPSQIGDLLREAGFESVQTPRVFRRFLTSVVTACKPAGQAGDQKKCQKKLTHRCVKLD